MNKHALVLLVSIPFVPSAVINKKTPLGIYFRCKIDGREYVSNNCTNCKATCNDIVTNQN